MTIIFILGMLCGIFFAGIVVIIGYLIGGLK